MEGLDVILDSLAIRQGFSLSSPLDGNERSRLQLDHCVIWHVVAVGAELADQFLQLLLPRKRLGQDAVDQDQVPTMNQALRNARHHNIPVEPVKGFGRHDSGIALLEGVVFGSNGAPLDVSSDSTIAMPCACEHRT